MPYPETFYDSDHFGLWPIGDKRVEYRCTLILHRLQLAKTFNDSGRSLLKTQVEWDADRCLCEVNRWDDVKKSLAHHWHTEAAAKAIDDGEPGNIVFEHVIPRRVVFEDLLKRFDDGGITTWEDVRDYLQPRRAIALVHKKEDKLLNVRWRQTMPTGWQANGEVVDASARYRWVNIELAPPRPAPPVVPPLAGATIGRGEKLRIVTALFEHQGDLPGLIDYRRVGGAEDREWLDTEECGQELTDSVALDVWLPGARRATGRSHETAGYATGLPVVLFFEVDSANLAVYLYRDVMGAPALRSRLSQELKVRGFSISDGDNAAQRRLTKVALADHGHDAVRALAAALAEIRGRLDRVTEAMFAAGVLA